MQWLSDEQWERIRNYFPEENIPDGRPGRKPGPGEISVRRDAVEIGPTRRGKGVKILAIVVLLKRISDRF